MLIPNKHLNQKYFYHPSKSPKEETKNYSFQETTQKYKIVY